MNTDKLELFYTLSCTLSFTETSKKHYISQTAVSQHIKSLESELGVQLVQRSSRHVQLTDAGRALAASVPEFIGSYHKMLDSLAPYTRAKRNLVIDYTGPIERSILRRALQNWPETLPRPELHATTQNQARNDLLGGTCDIVLSVEAELKDDEVSAEFVCEHDIRVALSASNPLSKKEVLTPEDIAGERIILLTPASAKNGNEHVRHFLAALGLSQNQVDTTDTIETQQFLIEMNMGISFLPYVPELFSDDVRFVPFSLPTDTHKIFVFYRAMSPHIAQAIRRIHDCGINP